MGIGLNLEVCSPVASNVWTVAVEVGTLQAAAEKGAYRGHVGRYTGGGDWGAGGCPGDQYAVVSQRIGLSRGDTSSVFCHYLGLCLPLSVNLRELVSGQLHHDADIIPFVYCQEGEGETDCLP